MFMRLALVAAATALTSVKASQCVVFDASWNLYALNVGGADYNLGTSDNWSNGKATALTTTGRPPFTGNNTQCFLSQFQNSFYILDADSSNPLDVYIYDATAKSWTTQKTTGSVDPSSMVAILDHDTNVFFALSGGELFQADFGSLKAAGGSAISWEDVGTPSFSTSGYSPVMALAQNHIHFFDTPGASAGVLDIFVIHFAFFQPATQLFTATSGNTVPATHGSTTSFFLDNSWQEQFVFIPDDNSAAYVLDAKDNTTVSLAAPPTSNSGSTYAASTAALVQLASSGTLSYIAYDQDTKATGGKWATINVSGISSGGGSSTASNTASATGTSTQTKMTTVTGSQTQTKTGTSTATSTSSATTSGAASQLMVGGGLASGLLGMAIAAFFSS